MNDVDFNRLKISYLVENTLFQEKVNFFLKDWLSDSEEVSVQTSGSTGTPKIFPISKQKMLHSAKMTCDFLNLKAENSALLCLPVEYISGKMMIVRSLQRNLKLYATEPSLKPLEKLQQPIDFCAMTPLQVENSLDKIHLIANLIIGGANVSVFLKRKIIENSHLTDKNKIFETYGMSETLSHISLKQIYPCEEVFFTIFDDIAMSQDDRGCLVINAPNLNSEILITNDLVEIKNEKQFRFLGRVDNVINSGGAKVFPEELENLAKKYISNELVFIGIPDEVLDQKLILVIEGEENPELRMKVQEIAFSKSFHKPKEVVFVAEIPRTPNGKISRRELLEYLMKNNLQK